MTIEVGMHTGKHRITLILQSADVDTHSFMCDNSEFFKQLACDLADRGREFIDIEFNAYVPEPEPEITIKNNEENKEPDIDF